MSTQDSKKQTQTVTLESLAEMIQQTQAAQAELLGNQEKTAQNLLNMEQRLTMIEGVQPKLDTEAKLDAAVAAAKPGLIGGFKQASVGKKALIVTATTAAVACAAYAGYKGVEYYKDRKAEGMPLLAVEAVPSVSPAKADAVRQALK